MFPSYDYIISLLQSLLNVNFFGGEGVSGEGLLLCTGKTHLLFSICRLYASLLILPSSVSSVFVLFSLPYMGVGRVN